MNVKLLRKVQKFLLDEPRRFDMSNWIVDSDSYEANVLKPPPCGTMCCIGGAAIVIHDKIKLNHTGRDNFQYSIFDKAIGTLELSRGQGENLFAYANWPGKFAKAYVAAKTPLQRAKVGVARIEHFIKTNGAD